MQGKENNRKIPDHHVFLSFGPTEVETVRKFEQNVKEHGGIAHLGSPEQFTQTHRKQLSQCTCLILLMSESSLTCASVRETVSWAVIQNIWILPVFLGVSEKEKLPQWGTQWLSRLKTKTTRKLYVKQDIHLNDLKKFGEELNYVFKHNKLNSIYEIATVLLFVLIAGIFLIRTLGFWSNSPNDMAIQHAEPTASQTATATITPTENNSSVTVVAHQEPTDAGAQTPNAQMAEVQPSKTIEKPAENRPAPKKLTDEEYVQANYGSTINKCIRLHQAQNLAKGNLQVIMVVDTKNQVIKTRMKPNHLKGLIGTRCLGKASKAWKIPNNSGKLKYVILKLEL